MTLVSAGCYDFGSVSGGVRDGGSPGVEGGSPSGGDAGSGGSDAQVPPPGDGSSSGGGFCASLSPTPTFCDDFDEYETSTLTSWDQSIEANGSVGLTTIGPFSRPSAMTAQTNIASVGENTEADVLKAFSAYQNKGIAIAIAFEVNIQQWDTATTGQIIAFEVIFKNSPTQFNQIVLNLNSLGVGGVSAQIAENATGADGGAAGYNSYPFKSHPATNAWTKVEVSLSVPNPTGTQSNTVTVKVDGVTQIDAQALQVPLQGGTPYVHLGIGYVATPATAWVVHYDDLVANITSF